MSKQLKIEYVDIDLLHENPRNPRQHPDDALEKLAASMEAFGWTNPIIVGKDDLVLAGHARLKTARKLKIASVPVVRVDLTEAEAALYMVADNKTQELTEWDWPKLGNLFSELDTGEIDLSISGFDMDEIGSLMHGLDETIKAKAGGEKTNKCPECGHEW